MRSHSKIGIADLKKMPISRLFAQTDEYRKTAFTSGNLSSGVSSFLQSPPLRTLRDGMFPTFLSFGFFGQRAICPQSQVTNGFHLAAAVKTDPGSWRREELASGRWRAS